MATSDARVLIYAPRLAEPEDDAASTAGEAAVVLAQSVMLDHLVEGLARLGWPTVVHTELDAAIAAARQGGLQAIVADARRHPDLARLGAEQLKAALSPRSIPVLGLGAAIQDGLLLDSFDLALGADLHPAQTALRLDALVRTAVAEEELALRSRTFGRLKASGSPPEDGPPLRILTVGEPSARFLPLKYELDALGAETTAAITAYTAFDYLHERAFDAVVLWTGDTHAEALSIAGGMRRNTRLFHIPTVLTLRPGVEILATEAYHRGLSDIVSALTPPRDTAARVVAFARRYRYEAALRENLDLSRYSGQMDSVTGLFTRDLFAAHLASLATACAARRRPLSVAVLRIADKPDAVRARAQGWLERAIPQIGSMIGRLVRAEDTAARLAPDVFALALPAATAAAARVASERIAAVIACTAFDAGEDQPPFTIDFDLGVAQIQPGEGAAAALERAARGALSRVAS